MKFQTPFHSGFLSRKSGCKHLESAGQTDAPMRQSSGVPLLSFSTNRTKNIKDFFFNLNQRVNGITPNLMQSIVTNLWNPSLLGSCNFPEGFQNCPSFPLLKQFHKVETKRKELPSQTTISPTGHSWKTGCGVAKLIQGGGLLGTDPIEGNRRWVQGGVLSWGERGMVSSNPFCRLCKKQKKDRPILSKVIIVTCLFLLGKMRTAAQQS